MGLQRTVRFSELPKVLVHDLERLQKEMNEKSTTKKRQRE